MEVNKLREIVIDALEDVKAVDIAELNVRKMTSVTDLMVVASGTSSRHVKSLADSVVMACKKAKMQPLGIEGEREGEWVLVDLGDIVVHVMQPTIREHYGLEKIWSVTEEKRELSQPL
ncbi:MAG: ribosome silencing factor [Gammaproteobacteria bacterium]